MWVVAPPTMQLYEDEAGGTRTHTPVKAKVFKTFVSAIPPRPHAP